MWVPGTPVRIGRNVPRMLTGASGFMSLSVNQPILRFE
jgi:hypothetical protein